jgi:hypothetical protein
MKPVLDLGHFTSAFDESFNFFEVFSLARLKALRVVQDKMDIILRTESCLDVGLSCFLVRYLLLEETRVSIRSEQRSYSKSHCDGNAEDFIDQRRLAASCLRDIGTPIRGHFARHEGNEPFQEPICEICGRTSLESDIDVKRKGNSSTEDTQQRSLLPWTIMRHLRIVRGYYGP